MSLITLNNIQNLLVPGLEGIMMNYNIYDTEWKDIYTVRSSDKQKEIYVEIGNLNAAGRFSSGAPIPMGSMSQQFVTTAANFNIGAGFPITADAVDDNLYPEEFANGTTSIHDNMLTFKEYQGVALFDNAFGAQSNPEYILGDGQPFCSQNHPIQQGTLSNQLSNAQLSITSYQDLIILVNQFEDYSGQPRKILPTHLYSGIPNEFQMQVVTESPYAPGTANNDINAVRSGGYIRGKYVTSHFMSSPFNFFLMTDYKDGAIYQNRKELSVVMDVDQSNRNLSVYGNERYRFVIPNFRCGAGCQSFN